MLFCGGLPYSLHLKEPVRVARQLGAIAQLVEHLNGIEVVWGSSPHGSTDSLGMPIGSSAREGYSFRKFLH